MPSSAPRAYAVIPSAGNVVRAMRTLETLRAAGLAVLMHAGGGSMKSQFKKADASGARYALIFGDDEVARGEVSLKDLRNADAPQRSLPLDDAAGWAAELLNA